MSEIINSKLKKLAPYNPYTENIGIHLDANESFISLPKSIIEKITTKIAQLQFNRYPDPFASEVCKAYGDYVGINSEFITAGNGSDEIISIIFNSFLEKGNKVLILEPDFSMYQFYCSISECEAVLLNKNSGLNFNTDDIIRAAIENKVSLIIFSNPCNPTGQGIEKSEVLKIVKSVECLVVVDEAYMEFWDQAIVQNAPNLKNLIVLKTCSKAAGLAALRLGFAVTNSELTSYLKAAKSPYNVNSTTQATGEIVLSEKEYLSNSIERILTSRIFVYNALKEFESEFDDFKVFDTHTNFVLVESANAGKIRAKLMNERISVRLLDKKYLRITAGSPEENDKLFSSLKQILVGM